ncbi:C40 family peptidase [Spiractinospora alimapuensis]|uniref:C40 family peptidase n=1 Tax=Spiractinospora alimapuensis TaxID=2820884 RepID=UPI001F3BC4E7|nr:bifunctional lytic transglycosylase/C40 family peptidase [Spiractinospora alimapuensis]
MTLLSPFVRPTPDDRGSCATRLAIGIGLVMVGTIVAALAIVSVSTVSSNMPGLLTGGVECRATGEQPGASDYAQDSIPENYLEIYQEAGEDRGIPWNVLAAIGQVETHHGRWEGPGVTEGWNEAGAAGPMQFGTQADLAATNTWGGEPVMATEDRPEQGYGVDGNDDGVVDVYDPEDAIPAAADYLIANGAPDDLPNAIFAYNRAWWYVEDVLDWADSYADGDFTVDGPTQRAVICTEREDGGPIGEAPDDLSQAVVDWALAQRGKPYLWGGTGPDAFDCSGLTLKAFEQVGVTIPRVARDQWAHGPEIPQGEEQPGDLVFFDTPHQDGGAGPGHVGMVVGDGLQVEAWCTDCGPIATRPYDDPNRSDILGFTRPLEHENAKAELGLD